MRHGYRRFSIGLDCRGRGPHRASDQFNSPIAIMDRFERMPMAFGFLGAPLSVDSVIKLRP